MNPIYRHGTPSAATLRFEKARPLVSNDRRVRTIAWAERLLWFAAVIGALLLK